MFARLRRPKFALKKGGFLIERGFLIGIGLICIASKRDRGSASNNKSNEILHCCATRLLIVLYDAV